VVPDKPSIAVLPFANLSGKEELGYFSDGITDEIITALSKLSGVFVISRTSSFTYRGQPIDIKQVGQKLGVRYVLEGSVRRSGGRVRVTSQLVDTNTGFQLWAERYDRKLKDSLDLQDEITKRIVASLSIELSAAEQRTLAKRYTNDMEAFDYFLRGQALFVRHSKDANERARDMFAKAIERDPVFARAYAALALTYADAYRFFWSRDVDEAGRQAVDLAQKAVSLDIDSPQANWVLGYVELFVSGNPKSAIESGKRALAFEPNNADGHALLAVSHIYVGQPDRARDLIQKAMRLNPHYPSQYPSVLGYAHFFSGRYDDARVALQEALEQNPERIPPNVYLAATYVRAGELDEARWQAKVIQLIDPLFNVKTWARRQPFSEPGTLESVVKDLERAGL
jgi:adenylate cyclase